VSNIFFPQVVLFPRDRPTSRSAPTGPNCYLMRAQTVVCILRNAFPVRCELVLYILFRLTFRFLTGVEAGWNTSTVTLLVVGGDEKRIQCLGV
jgi:hypothetical protein